MSSRRIVGLALGLATLSLAAPAGAFTNLGVVPASPTWEQIYARDGATSLYAGRLSAELVLSTGPNEGLIFQSGTFTETYSNTQLAIPFTAAQFQQSLSVWRNGVDISLWARLFQTIPPDSTAYIVFPEKDYPLWGGDWQYAPWSFTMELVFDDATVRWDVVPVAGQGITGRFPLEGLALADSDPRRWQVGAHQVGHPHRMSWWFLPNPGPGTTHVMHQRYAYDLGLVETKGDNLIDGCTPAPGLTVSEDNACYHSWGQPVNAIADGEIVDMVNDVADNAKAGTVDGLALNYIVQRIGRGQCIFYAHFQKGSIPPELAIGSKVAAGDVIGLVGNSGGSTAPHLHIDARDQCDLAQPPQAIPFYFAHTMVMNDQYAAPDELVTDGALESGQLARPQP